MVVLVIVKNERHDSEFRFHWRSMSLEIVMSIDFHAGRLVMGNLTFLIQGISVLRYPAEYQQLMYGVRSMFIGFVIILNRPPAKTIPESSIESWNAAESASISTDCLDGRSLKVFSTDELSVVCWKNALNWDEDSLNRPEYEMVSVNREELVEAARSSVNFLNQFFTNSFDCENRVWSESVARVSLGTKKPPT